MELSIFNPYSGKFAGYNITKGKLTTELHYKVDGRKLDAQHHIIIDQLEFGDKTESKDAVSLPIKLAVALLKDRNGVIDLNLPVTGSLDDPKFRSGADHLEGFRQHSGEGGDRAVRSARRRCSAAGRTSSSSTFSPAAARIDAARRTRSRPSCKALQGAPAAQDRGADRASCRPRSSGARRCRDSAPAERGDGPSAARKKGRGRGAPPASMTSIPPPSSTLLTQLYSPRWGANPSIPSR